MIKLSLIFIMLMPFSYAQIIVQKKDEPALRLRPLVKRLIEGSFTHLKGSKIYLTSKNFSDHTLFAAYPHYSRFFGKRCYKIQVSPRIWDYHISTDAIVGVISHELAHLTELDTMKYFLFDIVLLGKRILSKIGNLKHERRTDLRAILHGYASKLKQYRYWVYDLLDSKSLETYKKTYFTPQELDLLIKINQNKQYLIKSMMEDPPLNIDQLKKFIQKFS